MASGTKRLTGPVEPDQRGSYGQWNKKAHMASGTTRLTGPAEQDQRGSHGQWNKEAHMASGTRSKRLAWPVK